MTEIPEQARNVTRITCMVHQRLGSRVSECFRALGALGVLVENARCVRQRERARIWPFAGVRVELDLAPMEIFRTTISRDATAAVIRKLVEAADLDTPGRGAVFAQDIVEIGGLEPPAMEIESEFPGSVLHDLALITGILSRSGSGEALARIALKLGAAVPVIGLGTGTGIRDRLGLLRITVPPEKDVVHLMVPAHDAADLQRLLIEEGRLDRPGGGFLYETPVRAGVVDTLVRMGHQEHAASIEQIIAAVDNLKKGTSWRKRFAGIEDRRATADRRRRSKFREVIFVCAEGRAEDLVHAAMRAGAPGATIARVRCLTFSDVEGGVAARERGVLCVPHTLEQPVLEALRGVMEDGPDPVCRIQAVDAPAVFSHQRSA